MSEISFLMGSEEGEKQDFLEKEKARHRAAHPDAEVLQLFAFEADPAQLEEALFSPSLFTSYTMVILKHFEEAGKNAAALVKTILRYAKDNVETSSLYVLSSESSYSLPSSIQKALKKDQIITFWEMFENRKQDWIRTFFRKEGYTIAPDAIRYILDMIENNTLEMKNTCGQLAAFFTLEKKSDGAITLDDIASYVSHTKNEDGFSLFAQIARADLAKSLSSLKKMLTSDARSCMGLVPILLRQFRLLESYLVLYQGNGEAYALENATAFSTSGSEVKGIRSQRDKQTFAIARSHYTASEVRNIIAYLDRMDSAVKMAGTDEVRLTLELMLHTIIVGKGKAAPLTLENRMLDNCPAYRGRLG